LESKLLLLLTPIFHQAFVDQNNLGEFVLYFGLVLASFILDSNLAETALLSREELANFVHQHNTVTA
jgi:hypothetical protein